MPTGIYKRTRLPIAPKGFKNLVGKRFGYLTVLELVGISYSNWLCECDCGNKRKFYTSDLVGRHNYSCGCMSDLKSTTHGFCGTRFYRIWVCMKGRCYSKKSSNYKWYGEKGIKIEWNSFEDFKNDMYESYEIHVIQFGEKNTTIDRIDANKNYSKDNCRWATLLEQRHNRSKK